MKNKKIFIKFFLDIPKQQLVRFLKIITKEQLQAIIEIIYNVVQGVCYISEINKSVLSKHKNIIRKLVSKQTTLLQRKKLLVKIHTILPIFFTSVH
jgi:hypothetical protein